MQTVYRVLAIAVLAAGLLIAFESPAYACGLLDFDCMFGWSNRAQLRTDAERQNEQFTQQQETERARAQAAADAEIARINASAAATEQASALQLEQQRQAGLLSTEQARQQGEIMRAMLAQQASVQIAQVQANYGLLADSLAHQADIAQAGIQEAGLSERERISYSGRTNITIIISLVIVVVILLLRNRGRQVMYLDDPYRVTAPPALTAQQLRIQRMINQIEERAYHDQ